MPPTHTASSQPSESAPPSSRIAEAPTKPTANPPQVLFGDSGISIYGYYKPSVRTLLANIATGDGTLLHELTHALLDFELPDAPVWLNEGLASLHEQCRFRSDGDGPWIEGLVNWRLEGLQQVIRQGRLRSLGSMIEELDFRGIGRRYRGCRLTGRRAREQQDREWREQLGTGTHGARVLTRKGKRRLSRYLAKNSSGAF